MAKGGARTSGSHSIDPSPSTAGSREAAPASSSDSENPAHPNARKPSGGSGGGHGNSGK